jgi:S1-C subfamily serine protease
MFSKKSLLKQTQEPKEYNEVQKTWQSNIDSYKQSVVMIEIDSDIQFFNEESTNSVATGFVVDKELGIIATNRHVTRRSPTRHKIKFFDGSVYMGNVVYYDLFHDFGFIQLKNFEEIKKKPFYEYLKPVKLTSSYSLKKGTELFLIGNNEGVNYSVKTGSVVETNVPDNTFGSLIETNFDRSGGSSGSPVWDYNGNVVAIHAMGDSQSSLEVPIDYMVDALHYVKKSHNMRKNGGTTINVFDFDKGYVGALITTMPLFKIKRLVEYIPNKNETMQKIISIVNSHNFTQKENPEIIMIQNVIEDSPAANKLKPGDVILKLDSEVPANDLIKYEKLLDSNIKKTINFTVFRFGEILNISIDIAETRSQKIKEFLVVKNTVIHDLKLIYKMKFGYINEGVYVSQIGLSSPFSEITPQEMKSQKTNGDILLLAINSLKISNVSSLIENLNNICDRSNLYLEAIDLNVAFPRPEIFPLDFGELDEISRFNFDEENGGWKSSKIILKACANKLNHRINKENASKDKNFFNNFYSRMKEMKKFKVRSFKLSPL